MTDFNSVPSVGRIDPTNNGEIESSKLHPRLRCVLELRLDNDRS